MKTYQIEWRNANDEMRITNVQADSAAAAISMALLSGVVANIEGCRAL